MKEKEKSSLVDLGKRLLEASRKGHAEEVSMLMASGAPFTTDWVGPTSFRLHYYIPCVCQLNQKNP